MLKRTIKYTDFNDQQVEEVLYFNLTKAELLEMELSANNGFGDTLQRIIAAKDNQALIAEFKKIILGSYGKKSEDGKRFIKSKELREEFEQSAAYSELFMELATDENAASDFIRGVIPTDLGQELDKEIKEAGKNALPPPPPVHPNQTNE